MNHSKIIQNTWSRIRSDEICAELKKGRVYEAYPEVKHIVPVLPTSETPISDVKLHNVKFKYQDNQIIGTYDNYPCTVHFFTGRS